MKFLRKSENNCGLQKLHFLCWLSASIELYHLWPFNGLSLKETQKRFLCVSLIRNQQGHFAIDYQ